MRNLVLLFVILTFSLQSRAAVESFGDKASVGKLFYEVPGYNLDFEAERTGSTLKYRPNIAGITGVTVSFLGLFGIGYGFRNPIADEDTAKKGKSVYDDFRFSFAFEEMNFEINYQSFKGFYLDNTSKVDAGWSSGEPYYQDPEMKLENLSANFTYVWSPGDFALAATLDQTVRQTESGGSFLMGASIANTKFSSPTGLIPPAVGAEFDEDQTLTEASFLALNLKAGYGYSLIFAQHWYATLSAMLGPGVQIGTVKTPTTSESRQDLSYKVDALAGVGYNGDTLISGLIISLDATGFQTESTDISSQIHKINLFVGGRF